MLTRPLYTLSKPVIPNLVCAYQEAWVQIYVIISYLSKFFIFFYRIFCGFAQND